MHPALTHTAATRKERVELLCSASLTNKFFFLSQVFIHDFRNGLITSNEQPFNPSCGNACCAANAIQKSSSWTRDAPKRPLPLASICNWRPKRIRLCCAITREIIEQGLIDSEFIAQHTSGFERLCQHVQQFTAESVSRKSGLSAASIRGAAKAIVEAKACSLWWTMGVNQSYEGVRTAQAIINIALLTGNIGRPGTGANSITGQCNAMGSRLWSNTTNLIGHHKFEDPQDRARVSGVLNIPVESIPQQGSWSYERILREIDTGAIKGLWFILGYC